MSSLVLDLERSCKNSRSVDMVLVLCTRGRFCVCELNGNRGERCGVACYICRRKKKDQKSWEGVHSKIREREEREREGLLLVLYSIHLVRKMTWLSY